MGPFGPVELQRSGDGFEDVLRHTTDMALLQPGVPVGADTGQDCDLLAEAAEGHRAMDERRAIKVLLRP